MVTRRKRQSACILFGILLNKRLIAFLPAVLVSIGLPSFAAADSAREPVKVFILAGQSNMEGHGAISALDENGRERPGTLASLAGNPATAPLIMSWVDSQKPVAADSFEIRASNATFGDPAQGQVKQLRVECVIDGRTQILTAPENGVLNIPGPAGKLTIERAFYGDLPNGAKKDVTAVVRRLADSERSRIRWKAHNNVWVWFEGRKGRLAPGFGAGQDLFGPELGFGKVLGDASPGPVLIVKTAWGGKSLFADFRPPSSGGVVGPNYKLLLKTVEKVIADLPVEFPDLGRRKCEIAGLVWYQGWNDAYPKGAVPEYERNLVNLIQDLRRDLKSPKLPIVVGELTGPWVRADKPWAEIRQAQEAGSNVKLHPELKGDVVFVPTRDFVRAEKDSPGGWPAHEFDNAETYYRVGLACGEAMRKLLGLPTNGPRIRAN